MYNEMLAMVANMPRPATGSAEYQRWRRARIKLGVWKKSRREYFREYMKEYRKQARRCPKCGWQKGEA